MPCSRREGRSERGDLLGEPIGSVDLDVVCCLPDDSGPECEDRTAAQCAAEGGVNLGAGSCLPRRPRG